MALSTRIRDHAWLLVLVVLFISQSVVYAAVTPLFESPDESSHLQVIDYLAREHRLYPPQIPAEPATSGIAVAQTLRYHDPPLYYTPPLYHVLGALLTGWIGMADLQERLIPSPSWEEGWAPQRDADSWNKNVYVHLPGEAISSSPTVRAATVLRALSLALGVATVGCTYLLCLELWPGRRALALGATAWVAMNPQFIAISAGVTNDPLVIALFSLFLLQAVRALKMDTSRLFWVGLGVLVGVGLLTKQTALLLLPLGELAICIQARMLKQRVCRRVLGNSAAFSVAAVMVGGGWYLSNLAQGGDVLGTATHFGVAVPLAGIGLREVTAIFETYWAGFGWALISTPRWVYWFYFCVVGLALGGIARAALAREALRCEPARVRNGLGFLAAAWLLNLLTLLAWAVETGAPYGRLLFPTIAPFGVLMVHGLNQWRAMGVPKSVSRISTGIVAGIALLIAGGVPWGVLRPAYSSISRVAALPEQAAVIGLPFQDGITLLGYEAGTDALRQGESFELELYWLADQTQEQRLGTWVQLGPQDATRRIADVDRWLGGTLYPSELWHAGECVKEHHVLRIPADAPAPGLYWVRLGLVDRAGQRLRLSDGSDTVTLGPWRLYPRPADSVPEQRLEASMGDGIELLGYEVTHQVTAGFTVGSPLTVTLVWRASQAPAQDYTVFVHLMDGEGNQIAHHDGIPMAGQYPTSWWLEGDVMWDAHVLRPERLPGEALHLLVGMYDAVTGQRLPVLSVRQGRAIDNAVWVDWTPVDQDAIHGP